MRILHVLAHTSSDGSYGGPSVVALQQAEELSRRGHDVTLVTTSDGVVQLEGVRTVVFKARYLLGIRRFALLFSPSMMIWLRLNRHSFDVTHVHLARDLITTPAAIISTAGRLVVQPHGMVSGLSRVSARIFDALLIRRTLGRAVGVLALSHEEQAELAKIAMKARIVPFRNGVPASREVEAVRRREVLFLARLHERKNPLLFVEAADQLRYEFPDVTFAMVGPDGGESRRVAHRIDEAGLSDRVRLEGPIDHHLVADRMAQALVYVLPAVNEPFGLTVAEAMSAGTPVILGEQSALASDVVTNRAGMTFDGTAPSLAAAMRSYLEDPSRAAADGERARSYADRSLSVEPLIEKLTSIYRGALQQELAPTQIADNRKH